MAASPSVKIAVLDDHQGVALSAADWGRLRDRAHIDVFAGPIDPQDAARVLAPYDILVAMRERTAFPRSLIQQLPRLRMIALTGGRAPTLDMDACAERGVVVSNTGGAEVAAATAELAWLLLQACARSLPLADAGMRRGGWQHGIALGNALAGKRMGVVGLGRIGARVCRYARAFDMEVLAWSQNLTDDAATQAGARRVDKDELFATADAISLHLVLSDRTRQVVDAKALAAMKPGAILVNTARSGLIDGAALFAALQAGGITAGLDVFDTEPLAPDAPLRRLPNVVLTPHLGYSTGPVLRQFYQESVENILAFLDGSPIRVISRPA